MRDRANEHRWTDAELLFLCDVMGESTTAQIAERIGVNLKAVQTMIGKLKREYFVIP